MSVLAGQEWSYDGIKLFGLSLSGIRTCMALPDFSLCFDVAQGYPFAFYLKQYFITHGHLDHAAGIPYLISQKAMQNQPAPEFYMPESLVEPLTQIMNLWEKIENHTYQYVFHPIRGSEEIPVKGNFFMRPFPTVHRIESYGYTLFERKKKLKKEFAHLSESELIAKRKSGVVIQEEMESPLVSFTGDTQIEFLNSKPWIKKSKILIMESTYLDEKKSIEHAKTWGHTHLDEIIPILDEIESERIVLIHLSSRYSMQEALIQVQKRIPQKHRERIFIFPGR